MIFVQRETLSVLSLKKNCKTNIHTEQNQSTQYMAMK